MEGDLATDPTSSLKQAARNGGRNYDIGCRQEPEERGEFGEFWELSTPLSEWLLNACLHFQNTLS